MVYLEWYIVLELLHGHNIAYFKLVYLSMTQNYLELPKKSCVVKRKQMIVHAQVLNIFKRNFVALLFLKRYVGVRQRLLTGLSKG